MARLLAEIAARKPGAPGLVDEAGTTTWASLQVRTNRLIDALRTAGLRPGDTVALLTGNRREYFEVMSAGLHAGLFVVPVNWHWVARELAYVLDNSDAVALIVDDRFLPVAQEALRAPESARCRLRVAMTDDPPAGFDAYEALLASGSADEPPDQQAGGPMFYTSGTTGFPKGVRSSLLPPRGRSGLHGNPDADVARAPRPADRGRGAALRTWLPQRAVGVLDAPARRGSVGDHAPPLRPGGDARAHRPVRRHEPPPRADAVHPHAEAPGRDAGRVPRRLAGGRRARRGPLPVRGEAPDARLVGAEDHGVLRRDGGRLPDRDHRRGMAAQAGQRRPPDADGRALHRQGRRRARRAERARPDLLQEPIRRRLPLPQGSAEYAGGAPRARNRHARRRGLSRQGRLSLPERSQDRHDHLGRRQHLPGRDRERAGHAPGGGRRGGLRRAERGVRRGGEGRRGAGPGPGAVGGPGRGADRPRPPAARRLQGAALDRLRGAAPARADGQAHEAPAARPLLGGHGADDLITSRLQPTGSAGRRAARS